MTTANEHLRSIQSRIDELERTISERGAQIRNRTARLKEDLQEELEPAELIRKHPLQAAAGGVIAGILLGKAIRSIFGRPSSRPFAIAPTAQDGSNAIVVQHREAILPSAVKSVLASVGAEALHAGQDLAISWIKEFIAKKKGKDGENVKSA
jgi:hypothetical protein